MSLPPGLYDDLLTARLRASLKASGLHAELDPLDPAEAPAQLARHLHALLARALGTARDDLAAQLRVANRLIDALADALPEAGLDPTDRLDAERLLALVPPTSHLGAPEALPRPGIPLSESALLVNAQGEHRVGVELGRELRSADRVDLLLSFLKWSGYVRLREPLKDLLTRRPGALRVLSTVYLGATDRRVLDELHGLGAQIRISYDTRKTRLHAKAWLFHRETGRSTAYIGSSNLSAAAITDGLEWNVRLSRAEAPALLRKFAATFETYWSSEDFAAYDPARDATRFDRAVSAERGSDRGTLLAALEVRPYPFQQQILDRLTAERELHGRTRNLVVAATGTGKTVIAALDYKGLRRAGPLSLLFVAHRKEILAQSLSTFRQVLGDGSFGELLVDGARPVAGTHVFASVQSLSHVELSTLDPAAYDVVIVDEFHHAAAPTYARLLEHLEPRHLLGLTATPERGDGQDLLGLFGGRIAAELRLWEAIDRGLLAPFSYFGVHDGVDTAHAFKRGSFDLKALDGVYTGHHVRARLILKAVDAHVADPHRMKALGFCAGVAHADFMAERFNAAGLPALSLSALSSPADRATAIGRLRRGELAILFTVDLFNEGVDIPEVDTVLFLRPTESATVFLQQLGRGLRLSEGKEALTVLDFIGPSAQRFRFDIRYRALTGGSRREVAGWIRQGFPLLPAGCSAQLDPIAQEVVLDNLRTAIGSDKRSLVSELRALGEVDLPTFLREAAVSLEDIYRKRSFADLCRAAGHPVPAPGPDEARLGRALGRLIHVDDPDRLRAWRRCLDERGWHGAADLSHVRMLAALIGLEPLTDPGEALRALFAAHPALGAELRVLLSLLGDRVDHLSHPLEVPVPLRVHAHYRLQEIMAAFGQIRDDGRLHVPREGVWFDPETRCNCLFVTLQKSERDYSPSTMYEDYALSPTRFHWQSQSRTTPESLKGQRHLRHAELGVVPLLFVRARKHDERGETEPYALLGPVSLEQAEGARPMDVTWRLGRPMPPSIWEKVRLTG